MSIKKKKKLEKSSAIKNLRDVKCAGKSKGGTLTGTFEPGELLLSHEDLFNLFDRNVITREELRTKLGFSAIVPAKGEEHAVALLRNDYGLVHLYCDGKMLFVPNTKMSVKDFKDTGLKITIEPESLSINDVQKEEDVPDGEVDVAYTE